METKRVDQNWFNSLHVTDLKKYLICSNDGQGDTSVYTFDDVLTFFEDDDISTWSKIEILNTFFNQTELNGNNTKQVYFDDRGYVELEWID
jgi:hypothetical protein